MVGGVLFIAYHFVTRNIRIASALSVQLRRLVRVRVEKTVSNA